MMKDYNLLLHNYDIRNHPLKDMPDKVQKKYLKGLGCVLNNISSSQTMKSLFCSWSYSISGRNNESLFCNSNIAECISNAVSLNRVGISFFRCKYEFFFDCFYLVELYDSKLISQLASLLNKYGRNMFTKNALTETKAFFYNNEKLTNTKISNQIEHRRTNLYFQTRPIKKVLVVATVSAGKSTLINALTGHGYNSVKTTICTNKLCYQYNRNGSGITLKQLKDFVHYANIESHNSNESNEVSFHFQSSLGDSNICIIDTPGVNNAENKSHYNITINEVKKNDYDLLLFVSNGKYNGTNDEKELLCQIKKECRKPILFALNQLDDFKSKEDNIGEMMRNFWNELNTIGFNNSEIFPLSAKLASLCRKKNRDEDEQFELDIFDKRFNKDFYDLPRYVVNNIKSNTLIEKSGILLLEERILKLLK